MLAMIAMARPAIVVAARSMREMQYMWAPLLAVVAGVVATWRIWPLNAGADRGPPMANQCAIEAQSWQLGNRVAARQQAPPEGDWAAFDASANRSVSSIFSHPYTFIVMAMLILLATPFTLRNMATHIFRTGSAGSPLASFTGRA